MMIVGVRILFMLELFFVARTLGSVVRGINPVCGRNVSFERDGRNDDDLLEE